MYKELVIKVCWTKLAIVDVLVSAESTMCLCFTHFITEDLKTFQNESEDVFLYFRHRNLEAMLTAVKSSIDALRRRIITKWVSIPIF